MTNQEAMREIKRIYPTWKAWRRPGTDNFTIECDGLHGRMRLTGNAAWIIKVAKEALEIASETA